MQSSLQRSAAAMIAAAESATKHAEQEVLAAGESVLQLFKSRIASMRYVFKNGKTANFILGQYATDVESEITELHAEIKSGNPILHIDKDEPTKLFVEPIESLRAKIIAEYEAEKARTLNKNNDAGYSVQGRLNVANSSTVSEGAASSDSMVQSTTIAK